MMHPTRDRARDAAIVLGTWLLVTAVYVGTGPGRLDIFDAQFKFETAYSLLEHHDIALRDPILLQVLGFPSRPFSSYTLASSIVALPLVALGRWLGGPSRELPQFFFSFASALLGALVPATLLRTWLSLGLSRRSAFGWALACAFATLLWPTACSSFDQAQQALVILFAVLVANAAGRAQRPSLALLAGLISSVSLHYQPSSVVLIPALALGVLATPWRSLGWRDLKTPGALVLGTLPGVVSLLAYNLYRFGSPFAVAAAAGTAVAATTEPGSLLGHPLMGALVLAVSPGKGIIFFSPLVVVALLGVRPMLAAQPRLTRLILGVTLSHFALIASVPFPGGDWCWGPRYLVVTMPLLLLLLPFGAAQLRRPVLVTLLVVSIFVQLLGLSLDHQRFFFEHDLAPRFWANNHRFYFRESQLRSRVEELLDPAAPTRFRMWSNGHPSYMTYAPRGIDPRWEGRGRQWVRQYAMFFWPRPWPLWMARLPPGVRPFDLARAYLLLGALTLLGAGTVAWALASGKRSPQPAPPPAPPT